MRRVRWARPHASKANQPVGALLALSSAACYGIADFAGGLLSRRAGFVAVALAGQIGGFLLTVALAPLTPTGSVTCVDITWGAASGVGTGLGMMFLYRGLGRGAMSVVVPVSAVGGVALPVLVGAAILGDRPTVLSWFGIAIAVPALWFVSRAGDQAQLVTTASLDGLVASMGIAVQYLALAQAGADSGTWPVVAGRVTAILTIGLLAKPANTSLIQPTRLMFLAAVNGMVAALALVCYLLATRQQLVVLAVVLSSLYPAVPVLLGITLLRERLSITQMTGLLGTGVAIGFITAG